MTEIHSYDINFTISYKSLPNYSPVTSEYSLLNV